MRSAEAGALILARMAWADGEIDGSEREYLARVLPSEGDVERVLARAHDYKLPALALEVTHYPDRFVIVLRAALMATVNLELHPRERDLFENLSELMALTPADRDLIRDEAAKMAAGEPGPVHPRVAEMQRGSALSVAFDRVSPER